MSDHVSVLRDKNVNLKRLRKLVRAGLIEVYELDLENRPKGSRFVPPVAVYGTTAYGQSVYGGDADQERLKTILRIMGGGRQSIGDALTLDAAFRNGHGYVVTNDKDEFIANGKRERLEALLPQVKIVTPKELEIALGVSAEESTLDTNRRLDL
jgi:hypothetical protein